MRLTRVLNQVHMLTRLNVVDNSEIGRQVKEAGKKVKCIRVYNKSRENMGGLGDRVLVTILGQMKKGIIVGCVQTQKAFVPKFDKNNVVLLDNNHVPLGTRVTVPIPNYLRKQGATTARLMAIATKFV
uniref:Large ribosomal subunit protein uL14m n=1 Tax=Aceria tosichella TaxID=561515 RepID=A0A6G1S961_9ACAR